MSKSQTRTLRRLCVLAAIAASAMLASAAPAGAAVEKSLWGPDKFPVGHAECPVGPSPCSAFPLYRQLGVDVYQFQLPWSQVAKTRPEPAQPRRPCLHLARLRRLRGPTGGRKRDPAGDDG